MYSRVYVEITNICNMNCSFCHGHSRPLRQMTEEEYAHILKQLTGKTQYLYHHLMGEPLIHPELPKFIEMACQAGFRPMLTTNGTLLGRRGDELLIPGLHKVNISLHSFEGSCPEDHRQYLHKIAEFAEKANLAGVLISLRLWNKGFDGGRNDTALETLKEMLPGQWSENTRGYRIRDRLFLEWGERFDWPDQMPRTVETAYIATDCRTILGFSVTVPWSPAVWTATASSPLEMCSGRNYPTFWTLPGQKPLWKVFASEKSQRTYAAGAVTQGNSDRIRE